MARPREFDDTTVLEAAMHCFWAQGYQATSVRDLADHMGITGASLYNAFGDKRSLYRKALDHYLEQSVHDRVARLGKLPPMQALHAFFGEIVERSATDGKRRGCLLVNAALEMAPYDEEFRDVVVQEMAMLEAFFQRCITAGQADGTITTRQPAGALAKLLLSLLLGVRVLARTRPQRPVLQGAVDGALGMLAA
ncbi:TetR/AcrR family transcriptional regulator [Acidisphaera sp. L21]|jgi:TetR/AcrR family transcriptional repressor of nem operon|uniref:TetR/AcrR family transcriptional regulator n=1 Tax=Acidisphaera sp. L21 TaxID=1641851 RepID=UPI00131B31CA|nr:TetR/AcrR family transcriptional regulator [Acidisphaera sp. L21]